MGNLTASNLLTIHSWFPKVVSFPETDGGPAERFQIELRKLADVSQTRAICATWVSSASAI